MKENREKEVRFPGTKKKYGIACLGSIMKKEIGMQVFTANCQRTFPPKRKTGKALAMLHVVNCFFMSENFYLARYIVQQ